MKCLNPARTEVPDSMEVKQLYRNHSLERFLEMAEGDHCVFGDEALIGGGRVAVARVDPLPNGFARQKQHILTPQSSVTILHDGIFLAVKKNEVGNAKSCSGYGTVGSISCGFCGNRLVLYWGVFHHRCYLISQTVPRIIFALVGASIATGFVPMYSRVRSERDRQTADAFTNNLLNALLRLALVTVASVLVFARPLVRLFASGFQGPTMELAIKFTRITAFGTFFTGSMSIFASYLRLHGNFIVPALVGLPMNFVIIGSIFVSSKTSVYALAIGSVLATISELLICIPFLRRVDYVFKPVLDLSDEHLRAMVFIAVPVIVGISVTEINVLVDRTLASRIAVGGISALNYARRLNDSIQTIFVTSLTTVFYPLISKMAAEGNMGKLKITLAEALSLVNLLVVPATVGTMVFPREIVSLLFARGAFSQEAAAMTSDALFFYSIGMC